MPDAAISDAFVPDVSVDTMLNQMAAEIAGKRIKNVRVERPTSTMLAIHHRYTPGWAIILGILGLIFFLLGLLFFLVKSTETMTVIGHDVEGGARFTVTGSGDNKALWVLQTQLRPPQQQPPAQVQSPPAKRQSDVRPHRNCPNCNRPMNREATRCPHCQAGSRPWIQHAGVWWTQDEAGLWQWLDQNAKTWRWYEDGTPCSPSVTDRTPSLDIDPALVRPPDTQAFAEEDDEQLVAPQSPAPSAELERLGDLHARGILTDDEFRQAKQRVLDG